MTNQAASQTQVRITMPPKKRWQDLTQTQKIAIGILSVLQFALLGAALWDLHGRTADELNGPKWVWTAVSFINFFGPIAYFLFGRKKVRP